ncbi:MAG: HlyD family secretion protein [Paraglaciecola sp.]|jgi:multidrug efflux pump subunit AcrA (membrane-fusion protein)
MDIKKSIEPKSTSPKKIWIVGTVFTIVALSCWIMNQPSGADKVAKNQIWTDTVKLGDLDLEVEGYGKLKSKHQRLLTTPTHATVEEILLKPGSLVTKNSIIARLSNPEIAQKVREVKRSYSHAKATYLQVALKQKREVLAHQAFQEQLKSELEIAQLKMQAEEKLMKKGIVSELTFKRSELNHRQLSRRITIEKTRLEQLKEVHFQELAIEQDNIEQQKENVEAVTQQFNRLTVRAGIDGVVQKLPVELGQSVAMGEQIALVGSVDSLFAMINVSQSDIDLIAIDQLVDIDTRGGKITGKVQRINPLVKQGMISIEVSLTGELPSNARPDLNVNGVISVGILTQAMYIKKPVSASTGMKTQLFKVDESQEQAEKVAIIYGQESGEFIQILAGALEHDTFILSDMSRWNDSTHIAITQ